jgi:hypothetical protein
MRRRATVVERRGVPDERPSAAARRSDEATVVQRPAAGRQTVGERPVEEDAARVERP